MTLQERLGNDAARNGPRAVEPAAHRRAPPREGSGESWRAERQEQAAATMGRRQRGSDGSRSRRGCGIARAHGHARRAGDGCVAAQAVGMAIVIRAAGLAACLRVHRVRVVRLHRDVRMTALPCMEHRRSRERQDQQQHEATVRTGSRDSRARTLLAGSTVKHVHGFGRSSALWIRYYPGARRRAIDQGQVGAGSRALRRGRRSR